MRAYLNTHLMIALHALIIAVLVLSGAWYIHRTYSAIELQLETRIQESTRTLTELASLTDRNGADALTERIIVDCPRRGEFENLLSSLGSASRKDLISVQQLFESCGSFYAERKAFMVAQIEREYASLQNTLSLLSTVRDLTVEESELSKWESLIELERTRSSFLTEQTSIQAEIIRLLIEGSGNQARINELVRQAQSINESLSVTDAQIDELRATLM